MDLIGRKKITPMQRWLDYWLTEVYLWTMLDVYELLFWFSSGTKT